MQKGLVLTICLAVFALALLLAPLAHAQGPYRIVYPEQRQIEYRDPSAFPAIPLPPSSPPPTYSRPPTGDTRYFALDDAIRTSLENGRVVRLLAGVTAVSSGRTIYDPAIVNTTIDQALGRFDPFFQVNNNWNHFDQPFGAIIDPVNGNRIVGATRDQYDMNLSLAKDNPLGGQWLLGVDVRDQRFPLSFVPDSNLNPQTNASTAIGYTQPFLQGFGLRANLAPVVLARINTEISFFQLKDAVQQNVRDVIAAYWNLVAARATKIARETQENTLRAQFERVDSMRRFGLVDLATSSQVHVSYAQFKAQRIAAETDVLQREAALRNLIGLPPWDEARLVPTTEPLPERVNPDWYELVDLAAARRPDLVELKLVLEADEQQRIIANNNALPQLNGNALYRWNGLSGELPAGNGIIASQPGQFADWTLGVNFSVPIGLRSARAQLRQRELLIARDRANLEQGLHSASHELATTLRSLDQAYEQYVAFTEAHKPAQESRDQREREINVGFANFLNYLLAVTDLGNVIAGEAQALAQYNTLLADLELQTGTILETHGVRFFEERYGSIGPLGRLAEPVCYPESTPQSPHADRYPIGVRPAEQFFDLPDPNRIRSPNPRPESLPRAPLGPPGQEAFPLPPR
jgi:outer membrane protein TolC